MHQPVAESLADFAAVLLVGARQVGKSTLAAQLVEEGILAANTTLDDAAVLAAAQSDPQGFVAGLAHGTAIDEVQRVPDLLRAIKLAIDRDRQRGRFLLTGSANVLSLPTTTESLAGRAALLELDGLSLAELEGRDPPLGLLDLLFDDDKWPVAMERLRALTSPLPPARQREQVFFGGFPEVALRRSATFHERWFRSYFSLYVERDARDLARIPDTAAFGQLFRLVASASGQLANMAQLGSDARIDQRTSSRYLQLLELTFHVNRLSPWFRNVRKKLVKTPKLYVRDSGFACHLIGITEPSQLEGHRSAGSLWESWVFGELRKLMAMTHGVELTFYRVHGAEEIDFVMQRGDTLAAVEVKGGQTVGPDDFRGVRALRELTGKELRGLVMYGGSEVVSFGEGLAAVPFGVFGGVKRAVRKKKTARK